MNEIMQAIANAEEEAAKIKEQAKIRAGEIVSEAEEEAAAALKSAEIKAKTIREEGIRAAQRRADEEYTATLGRSRAEATAYADERCGKTEAIANEIVRRIVSGS